MSNKHKIFLIGALVLGLMSITVYILLFKPGDYHISGKITYINNCHSYIGSIGCEVRIGHNTVSYGSGSAIDISDWAGQNITGLSITKDDLGKKVEVFAHRTGFRTYEVYPEPPYYIKAVDQQ